MPLDRFLIAPLDKGLQNDLRPLLLKYASFWYDMLFTKGSILKERKLRKDIINLIGQRFGKLMVINLAPRKRRGALWECICDCGKTTVAWGGHLRNGTRISCGCIQFEDVENTGVRRLMSMYFLKARKRHRNFNFELSFEQFRNLIKSNCYYCGIEPKQVLKRLKNDKVAVIYNGIDRINPEESYTVINSVPSCFTCNKMKATMSVEDWFEHMKRIFKWHKIDFS